MTRRKRARLRRLSNYATRFYVRQGGAALRAMGRNQMWVREFFEAHGDRGGLELAEAVSVCTRGKHSRGFGR